MYCFYLDRKFTLNAVIKICRKNSSLSSRINIPYHFNIFKTRMYCKVKVYAQVT